MTDLFDRAAEREQELRADALAAHKRRAARAAQAAESAAQCADCDAPIPQARREAVPGVQRCVECQAIHERYP